MNDDDVIALGERAIEQVRRMEIENRVMLASLSMPLAEGDERPPTRIGISHPGGIPTSLDLPFISANRANADF